MAEIEKNAEDAEFKAFCAILKKDPPRMEEIKAGVEKFGLRQLSDSQKDLFLRSFFPKPLQPGVKESHKLGFQNLNGIKNCLAALLELQKDGKISNDNIKAFLTMTNPENGRNVMTTIALNTKALEFKDKKIRKEGSKEFIARLDNCKNVMIAIQESFSEIDPQILAEAANTPDDSRGIGDAKVRKLTYRELAAKSSVLMKTNLERIAPYLAQLDAQRHAQQPARSDDSAITIDADENSETLKLGGTVNDTPVSIDGATPPPPPAPQNTDEEKEPKIATFENPEQDPSVGKKPHDWNFKPVREQDIIDYMFNEWFIASVNFALESTFKGADWLLDALIGNSENVPSVSATAYAKPRQSRSAGIPSGSSRAASGSDGADGSAASAQTPVSENLFLKDFEALTATNAENYFDLMKKMANHPNAAAYAKVLLENIQNNIGKEPKKWKCNDFLSSEGKSTPLSPDFPKNVKIIEKLNQMYQEDPQGFNKKLHQLQKNPQLMLQTTNKRALLWAASLATLDYATTHLHEGFSDKEGAERKTGKDTFTKINELTQTCVQIALKNETQYRLEHNIGAKQELTDKQKSEILGNTQKELSEYRDGVLTRAVALKNLLGQYHMEQDTSQKAILEKQIKEAQKNYSDFYGQYLPDGKEGDRSNNSTAKTLPGPVTLKDEAARANQADKLNKQFTNMITTALSDLEAQQTQTQTRQQNFVQKRDHILEDDTRVAAQQTFFHAVWGQNRGITK